MKKYFAMLVVIAMAVVLGCSVAALAADKAEKGKEYEITITGEENNPFVGAFGYATIGTIEVDISGATKGEKYKIKVTDIKFNTFTSKDQASCTYVEIGGKGRKGDCLSAP
jgi:hypothetical protein